MIKSLIKLHVHCVLLVLNITGWWIIYEYMIFDKERDSDSHIRQIEIVLNKVDVES